MICAYPPPVAPPFNPKTGPIEGSLKAIKVFLWSWLRIASPKPIVIVDFPSPAGVGLIDVTKINFPSFWFFLMQLIPFQLILALSLP